MKNIIFCADDYGQNPTISQAIIDLLLKKRLSATSCLTTSSYWLEHAKWLEPFKNQADIGLHFNLTEGRLLSTSLSSMPVSQLLIRSHLHQLNQAAIETELNAQLDQFIAGVGQLPHFIDGHQHIHQLPIIRDALFNVYEKRLRSHNVYLRCVHNPKILWQITQSGYLKKLIIELFSSFAFKKALISRKIPHNTTFSGIYSFKKANIYPLLFPQFLLDLQNYGLLMCHPGQKSNDPNDPISTARFYEYEFLQTVDLNSLEVAPSRFNSP